MNVASQLLAWYDRHARALPWRSPPGTPPPDPYRVWLSEVMLQQTTVAAVRTHFARFTQRWPTVRDLAAAHDEAVMTAWAGLGYYARARNMLACARAVVADHGGHFPGDEQGLLTLPGIGRYTAAAIAAIAFGRRAVVVDGNVERVVARLFAVETPLPAAKPELYALTDRITPSERPGDFAQAMMDLGATICTPRNPLCALCPLDRDCAARASGDPARLPRKVPKAARPRRYGTIFWIEHDGAVLLVRRPDKGLLGGMRALPTGPWVEADPGLADAPAALDWRWIGGHVEHVFTHFALELRVACGLPEKGCASQLDGEWWPIERLDTAGLPTVFAKAARRAIEGEADG
ncbi:A/G-specific adenine glycosylase [Sphingomonas colocasiae]|uniref:A/G-specific adenine glycosylase n=1 Tax=Sphingomonas colocasiae TaxID=1848973 RepID=UPI0031BB088B